MLSREELVAGEEEANISSCPPCRAKINWHSGRTLVKKGPFRTIPLPEILSKHSSQYVMLQLPKQKADPDNTATWARFTPKLCRHCDACCCSLPVEVKAADLVRMELIDEFSLQEDLKYLARKLMKDRLIEHFHARTATFTLARRANGDCIYLDSLIRRCTIYALRPDTCRNHPQIGPRAGYCAFRLKEAV